MEIRLDLEETKEAVRKFVGQPHAEVQFTAKPAAGQLESFTAVVTFTAQEGESVVGTDETKSGDDEGSGVAEATS